MTCLARIPLTLLAAYDRWIGGPGRRFLKGHLSPQGRLFRGLAKVAHFENRLVERYRRRISSGMFFRESELRMASLFPQRVLDHVIATFQPSTLLDVGCGTGVSLAYFQSHGIETTGVEGSALAIRRARHPDRIIQHDLSEELDLNRRFDLVWCYEVAEHLAPQYARTLVKTMVNHADLVLLSAARPGQGGEGHLNEQPREYWVALFAEHGFELDEDATAALLSLHDRGAGNMMVLRRAAPRA